MCHQANETISRIVSRCTKLAQAEYKTTHDNYVAIAAHGDLTGKCGFQQADKFLDKWFEHEPESVLENEKYKLRWDCNIQTDHHVKVRRSDLVVVKKTGKMCQIDDVAILVDTAVREKQQKKMKKYHDLAREVGKCGRLK